MNIDTSDAATGLPPLEEGPAGVHVEADPYAAFLPLLGASGGESVMRVPGHDETVAVRLLHLRGLLASPDRGDEADWVQTTLAIPSELIDPIIAALARGRPRE